MEFYILFVIVGFAFFFIMHKNAFRKETPKEARERAKRESFEYDTTMSRKEYEQWCYERNMEPVSDHSINFKKKKKTKKRKKRRK